MLNDLTVLSVEGNYVTVGFTEDEQNAKAQGHITGKDGVIFKNGRSFPVRDFLGLPQEEVDAMVQDLAKSNEKFQALDVLARSSELLKGLFLTETKTLPKP